MELPDTAKYADTFTGSDQYEGLRWVTNVSLNTRSPLLCALAASLFPGPPRRTSSFSVMALENNQERNFEGEKPVEVAEPIIGLYGPPIETSPKPVPAARTANFTPDTIIIEDSPAAPTESRPIKLSPAPESPWKAAAAAARRKTQETTGKPPSPLAQEPAKPSPKSKPAEKNKPPKTATEIQESLF